MAAARKNPIKSNESESETLVAYSRAALRKMRLRTIFVTACLTIVGTHQATKWFGSKLTPEAAYEQGVKCASDAAATAFQIKGFNKDLIGQELHKSDLLNCLAKGPK